MQSSQYQSKSSSSYGPGFISVVNLLNVHSTRFSTASTFSQVEHVSSTVRAPAFGVGLLEVFHVLCERHPGSVGVGGVGLEECVGELVEFFGCGSALAHLIFSIISAGW